MPSHLVNGVHKMITVIIRKIFIYKQCIFFIIQRKRSMQKMMSYCLKTTVNKVCAAYNTPKPHQQSGSSTLNKSQLYKVLDDWRTGRVRLAYSK
jgi:hypothetical protein